MKARYYLALIVAFALPVGVSAVHAQQEPAAEAAAAPNGDTAQAAKSDQNAADAPVKKGKGKKAKKKADKSAEADGVRRPLESIMFSTDEFNEIQSRIASGEVTDTNQSRQAIEDATLYLSTIVYYGPKDWTIWVNGVPIGPSQEFQAFQVTEIDPSSVQLLVPLSAQGMRPVRLSPNQTFITKTGLVVEGRVQQ